MLWVYDNAIVDDLKRCFTPNDGGEPAVCVVPPDDIVSIAAQVQDDNLHFPMIAVSRETNIPIDSSLMNFSRAHHGVATVVDKEKNLIYYEKTVPLKLIYTLVCMGTNTADIDELIRELIFKYTSQYFLTVTIPYESKRKIRFGVRIDPDENIEWYTTTSNYLQEGKLHSAGITLHIDGAVYVHYTSEKLRRLDMEIDIENPTHSTN